MNYTDIFFFNNLNPDKWIILYNLLYYIIPINYNIKNRLLLNIFFLDLIVCYRGWRHLKGLPVRGQRTWTNAWTVYKNNLILREYKIIITKKLYGNLSIEKLNITYLSEQINLLWKLQWENEWKEAKKNRLLLVKSKFSTININLNLLSKGIFFNKKNKKNINKIKLNKNVFSLGFDPGFTKALIKLDNSIIYKKKKINKQKRINLIFNDLNIKNKK